MINVYDKGNTAYDKNGNVIVLPLKGSVRMVAGGNYDMQMTCPMDKEENWKHLIRETIIKAPVPEETIENAFAGMEADVYVLTAAAALRSGPSEPTQITYGSWVSGATYSVGAKVTYNGHNYQCNSFDAESGYIMVPPANSPWWSRIADKTTGSPALASFRSGTELYYVSGPTDGWYKMSTTYGLEGYIKSTQVQYEKHLTPEEIKPRIITEQLFRIKTVNRDSEARTVTINAQHVSYDLNGVQIDEIKIVRKPPAEALAWIQAGFMIDYRGTIATDMITKADAEYSAEISGKSGMYALIDPDKGVVPCFGAEFRRDNWDLFIMNKVNADRGFRIRYRNNMRGVQWKTDSTKLKTRIVPVAKAEDGSNLYLENTRWVDSSHINEYETVYMDRLKVNGQVGKDDGTETDTKWTVATLRAEMQKQAQSLFDVDHVDVPTEEITVAFEMMGDTAEHPWLKKLQSVLLYDTVICIDEDTGLSASVTVDELEFDIVKKKITALKLTNYKAYHVKNVSGFNVLDNSITGDKLTDDAGNELMSAAVDEAVDEAGDYTDQKAYQTLTSAKDYTDEQTADAISTAASNTSSAIGTYDTQLKYWLTQHYQPL